jgi:hypothetical protein
MGEDIAEFFLGGDDGDFASGLGGGGEDGVGAEITGGVHHDLLVAGGVIEEVAADAVHGGRHAGDDRGVVDVGEGGQGAAGKAAKPFAADSLEVGDAPRKSAAATR